MNKSQPKYSHGFYKKTLFLSVGAIAASVAILLSIFSILTYRSYLKSTVDSVAKQNETCYLQINSVLENCTRICMFFSQYQTASPVFQSNTSEKTKKLVLQKEISTFISCFDYIAGIYVDTGDYVMQGRITEPLNDLTSAGTYSSFDISYTDSEKWPHIIRIEYIPESSSFFHVYIDIFADYLSSQYFSENTFCISENGTILMTKDLSLLGQNLAKLKGASARELISSDSSKDFIKSSSALLESTLSAGTIEDKSELLRSVYYPLVLAFLSCILVLAVAILMLYIILQKIYRPIGNTVEALKYYLPNDDVLAEDEVKFISECIGDYGINEQTQNTVLQIRKSQLHNLHSQISPHFLGNSLESLKWKSAKYLGFNNEISHSIGTLAAFFKDMGHYVKMITTIQAEIEQTKEYIALAVCCFEIDINTQWCVDESLLDYSIINFTLQPLIENSIHHGFRTKEAKERAELKITVESTDGDDIKITVKDNGDGIEPKTMSELKSNVFSDEPCAKHIGLKNTHLKSKILYGEKYGIKSIKSDQNGTEIIMLIAKHYPPHR